MSKTLIGSAVCREFESVRERQLKDVTFSYAEECNCDHVAVLSCHKSALL